MSRPSLLERDKISGNVLAKQKELDDRIRKLEENQLTVQMADRRYSGNTISLISAGALGFILSRLGIVGFWMGHININAQNAESFVNATRSPLNMIGSPLPFVTKNSNLSIPYLRCPGSPSYWRCTTDPALIIGNEAEVDSSYWGLTFMAWVRFDNTASGNEQIVGKNKGGANNTWYLVRDTNGNLKTMVSTDGTTLLTAVGPQTLGAGTWYCVGYQFIPSTSVTGFLNGVLEASITSSVPATLNVNSAQLTMGATDNPASYMTGDIALPFMCASALPDVDFLTYFQLTKSIFGVL
jgi:hypothetical protein